MRKAVSLLVALCLLAACCTAGAEGPHLEGKPWINSNFYGLWPSEKPAVEENFELYANYDLYMKALARGERRNYLPLDEASEQIIERQMSMYTDASLPGPEVAHSIHPFCYIRINYTVQHFDEFYAAYPSVTEGTPMYLAPGDRVLVW